jgi:transcriptional regulator
MPDALPLLKGTLDVLVLKALAWGPMHGFEITSWLEDRSQGLLGVDEGALYHALHRLEERSMIGSEWRVTENNRRARYYRLLPPGRSHLKSEGLNLERYARALTAILTARSA